MNTRMTPSTRITLRNRPARRSPPARLTRRRSVFLTEPIRHCPLAVKSKTYTTATEDGELRECAVFSHVSCTRRWLWPLPSAQITADGDCVWTFGVRRSARHRRSIPARPHPWLWCDPHSRPMVPRRNRRESMPSLHQTHWTRSGEPVFPSSGGIVTPRAVSTSVRRHS